MRVVILRTSRQAAAAVARLIALAVRRAPDLVLGLPTGRTSIPVYDELAEWHRRRRLDYSRITTFNLDEFAGLEPDDPRSYRAFMQAHLFDRINARPSNMHIPDGAARNWRREVDAYEAALRDAGGLDLCFVGIGKNGHLGFNEPAAALDARTHRAVLRAETRRANAHLFKGRWRDVPRYALSMGIGTILNARAIVLLATGPEKAAVVRRAITGPVTTHVPGSLLQLHPNVVVVLDKDAAGKVLQVRRVRRVRRVR
jgi:glucosamine-6-phosphate deaminase